MEKLIKWNMRYVITQENPMYSIESFQSKGHFGNIPNMYSATVEIK